MNAKSLDWPRVARAVAALYAYRTAVAWFLSYPAASELASRVARFPEGDRLLFEPGAMHLLEALAVSAPHLTASGPTLALAAVVASFAGLVPLWWLMTALGSASGPRAADRARGQIGSFVLLAGVVSMGRAVSVAAIGSLGLSAHTALDRALDERLADAALLSVGGCGLVLLLLSAALHDLARAVVVRLNVSAFAALGLAFRAAGRNWPQVAATLGCHAASVLGALALVLTSARLVGWMDVSGPGWAPALGSLCTHQLTALALIAVRALWLRTACARAERLACAEAASQAEAFL